MYVLVLLSQKYEYVVNYCIVSYMGRFCNTEVAIIDSLDRQMWKELSSQTAESIDLIKFTFQIVLFTMLHSL